MEQEHFQPSASRKIEWAVWAAIGLTILVVAAVFVRSQLDQRLLVDLRPISSLPEFTLTNQDGRSFALADMRGSIWVADIVFTRCAAVCPTMTRNMSELQTVLSPKDPVRLLTLTTDPGWDRPEVMKRWGERFKANFDRWTFLSGNKTEIVRLAVDGLKLADVEKKPEERENERDLFIHSELFVLVDKQGRLRGSVESYDPKMKQKVAAAVKQLLREK